MRLSLRKVYFSPNDIWKTITQKRHKFEPPKGDIYIGSGDFIMQGIHQLELLKTHINLKQDDSVLDIGSGIGRTAVALTEYLTIEGSYEGFDVVEKGVKWCRHKIGEAFPNFKFSYVPLNNDLYNKNKVEAKSFKFPYNDNSFDKAFLFSVFTHMSTKEIANYLFEIKRVLKPGGLCLATFFAYSAAIKEWVASNSHFSFPVDKGNYRLMSKNVKSANIALQADFLDKLIIDAGLRKIKVMEGYWKKDVSKQQNNDYQDIVIIEA